MQERSGMYTDSERGRNYGLLCDQRLRQKKITKKKKLPSTLATVLVCVKMNTLYILVRTNFGTNYIRGGL